MVATDYKYLYIAIRYESVLESFEIERLKTFLTELGYVIASDMPSPAFGARIRGSGVLARKSGVELTFDTYRQVWGVRTEDLDTLTKEFESLETRINKETDLGERVSFYEFLGEAFCKSQKQPSSQIDKLFTGIPVLEKFASSLDDSPSLSSLRFVPKGKDPLASKNFYDIKIEAYPRDWSRYYIQLVFRNQERTKVTDFVARLPQSIEKWIAFIERG